MTDFLFENIGLIMLCAICAVMVMVTALFVEQRIIDRLVRLQRWARIRAAWAEPEAKDEQKRWVDHAGGISWAIGRIEHGDVPKWSDILNAERKLREEGRVRRVGD